MPHKTEPPAEKDNEKKDKPLFITLVAAILLEKDYAVFMQWLKTSEDMSFLWKALEGVLNYIVTFLKAQGIILLKLSNYSITLKISRSHALFNS